MLISGTCSSGAAKSASNAGKQRGGSIPGNIHVSCRLEEASRGAGPEASEGRGKRVCCIVINPGYWPELGLFGTCWAVGHRQVFIVKCEALESLHGCLELLSRAAVFISCLCRCAAHVQRLTCVVVEWHSLAGYAVPGSRLA